MALLLSALFVVPLRDVIAMCLTPYFPSVVARGIGYGVIGAVLYLFFFVPFLCHFKFKKDVMILGIVILSGLLFFGICRPEEISLLYAALLVKSMFVAFPYYVIARSLRDYKMLEQSLYTASFFINGMALITMQYRMNIDGLLYSMGLAYAVLPGAIIAFRMLLRKFSFVAILNVGISLITLIFSGTRGPVVCFLLFCFYEMIFNRKMAERNAIKKILIVCVAILVSVSVVPKMFFERDIVEVLGGSRRFISVLDKRSQFFVSTDRDRMRQVAWEIINEHPFLGVGLLEDRLQILQRGFPSRHPSNKYEGYYSHFVFLDWLLEYGIIAGTLISLSLLFLVFRTFTMPPCSSKTCLEIFCFSGMVPLLFSGIWHEERLFLIFLGFCISAFCDPVSKISRAEI